MLPADDFPHDAPGPPLQGHPQLRSELGDGQAAEAVGGNGVEVVPEGSLEGGLGLGVLLPGAAEEDAGPAEVEGGDDDAEGDEAGVGVCEFMLLEEGHGVLLQLEALHRQLQEVVVPPEVGRVVHEQHQQLGRYVDQLVPAHLQPQSALAVYPLNLHH